MRSTVRIYDAFRTAALVGVMLQAAFFLWPFVNSTGEVTDGAYRGIHTGNSRGQVLSITMSPYSRIKLSGFEANGQYQSIHALRSDRNTGEDLATATKWYLTYPGIHKEIILVEFGENGGVRSIRYRRDALSP